MANTDKTLCEYNDWYIIEHNGKLYCIDSDDETHEVEEVFRMPSDAYYNYESNEIDLINGPKGIDFDICGELDDCSAFVYWRYAAA